MQTAVSFTATSRPMKCFTLRFIFLMLVVVWTDHVLSSAQSAAPFLHHRIDVRGIAAVDFLDYLECICLSSTRCGCHLGTTGNTIFDACTGVWCTVCFAMTAWLIDVNGPHTFRCTAGKTLPATNTRSRCPDLIT